MGRMAALTTLDMIKDTVIYPFSEVSRRPYLLFLPLQLSHRIHRCFFLTVLLFPAGLSGGPVHNAVFSFRFSASYGGEEAIAVDACISYVISVVYLILQGV